MAEPLESVSFLIEHANHAEYIVDVLRIIYKEEYHCKENISALFENIDHIEEISKKLREESQKGDVDQTTLDEAIRQCSKSSCQML